MPRMRALKPAFFTDDELAEVEMAGRLLYQGLWCVADRNGNLEYRPKRIKAEVLPYDDVDIESLVSQLEPHFVRRYEVEGSTYLHLPQFSKHQRPHNNEPATCPAPADFSSAPDSEPRGKGSILSPSEKIPIESEINPTKREWEWEPITDYGDGNGDGKRAPAAVEQEHQPAMSERANEPPSSPLDVLEGWQRQEIVELVQVLCPENAEDTTRLKAIVRTYLKAMEKFEGCDPVAIAYDYAVWQQGEIEAKRAGKRSAKTQTNRIQGWANQIAQKGSWPKFQRKPPEPEEPKPLQFYQATEEERAFREKVYEAEANSPAAIDLRRRAAERLARRKASSA